MISSPTIAAILPPQIRKDIGILALSRSMPIACIARESQVSRAATQVLNESFLTDKGDDEVLFYLPITKTWLFQLILVLVSSCHNSYRGVVELLRDLLDWPISVGTVHSRLRVAAAKAEKINQVQETPPNQKGKPTQKPTLRWSLQCFQTVHLAWFGGGKHLIKLNDRQRPNFSFLCRACQKYYLSVS